jgi:putative acetyltransferase
MPPLISPERPDAPDAQALVAELDAHLALFYPVESRHGFSVAKLLTENVAFFVSRYDGAPAGCGGLKLVGRDYGEIKRMWVRPQYRGLGLGKLMLDHLVEYARQQGVGIVRLETGIHQREAIGLYEQAGFQRIRPFAEYTDDPLSRCYEKRLH